MPEDSPVTRTLVVDTHPMFALGVAEALRAQVGLWVQLLAGEPRGVTASDQADVAVVGIDGDVRTIWEICDHLHSVWVNQGPRVVLILPGRSQFEMTAAASMGAAAVLPRTAGAASIVEAVQAVVSGRSLVGGGLAGRMLDEFAGLLRQRREQADTGLTPRETEVLQLVSQGRSNREISASLHISENTVKNHMRRLMEKLGAASRTEAVAVAARSGMIQLGQGPPGSSR